MVPVLILLCIAGAPQTVLATSGSLCQAVGRPELLSTWGTLNSILTVAAVVLGLPWGIEGVAVALVIRTYALLPLGFIPATKAADIRMGSIWRTARTPFLASVGMAAVVAVVGLGLGAVAPPLPTLCVQVLLGAVLYLVPLALLDRDSLRDVELLIRRPRPAAQVS
jgi:PST family polysaccharide transporter